MTQSFFRALFASLAMATLLSVATPASAVILTFTDNGCGSLALTQTSPGNFTLTCQALSCTLTAVPAAPTPGTTTTMTASCSGGTGAITFSNWISATGGCPPVNGAGATGTAMSASAIGPCTYRVTGTDTASLTGTASVNVTWSSSPPVAPSGCTLTANPPSLASAGNVTLTSACSGGSAPNSWAWTGPGVVTPTSSNSQIVNVTATSTFGVTPSASGVAGNNATVQVSVGGGGGGSLPTTCTIGSTTYGVVDMGTLSNPDGVPKVSTGFNGKTVAIATFAPPAGLATSTNTISVFEEFTGPISRKAWLSKTPCDSSPVWPAYSSDTGPVFNYSIGGSDPSAVNMKPGEKWYLMVANIKPFGGNSCTSGPCEIGIKWYHPF